MFVGASCTLAAARISSIGTGNRSQASARSRRLLALCSTARRSSGSRLLSSGFFNRSPSGPHELKIFHQLCLFLRREVVLSKRRRAPVPLIRWPFGWRRQITRQFHELFEAYAVQLGQGVEDVRRGLLNLVVLDLAEIRIRHL